MGESDDDGFRFVTRLDVRLRDLDPMGHVNNGVYATYMEQAREDYFRSVLEKGLLDDRNTVTARQVIEYERPIPADHREVAVAVRVDDIGESSVTLAYELRVDGAVAATGETVQVAYDRAAGAAVPVPESWRSAIEAFEAGEGAPDGDDPG
jgi:acyl-CoA thioester hydrolase